MPLPEPNDGESKDDFMERCMAAMGDMGEDMEHEQMVAVCMTQWGKGERALEVRSFKGAEVRASTDGDAPSIQGYAAVFHKLSQPLEFGFREKIIPGAFSRTIKDGDVRALFNHDPNLLLGRTTSGTLELREDDHGLWFQVKPPDTPWAHALLESIKRGDVSQASFGFEVMDDEWVKMDKQPVRVLREVRLWDVSPVTFPAYLDTAVQARDLMGVRAQLERLRDESGPAESHPDETGPAESHPDPVRIRPISVLMRELVLLKRYD